MRRRVAIVAAMVAMMFGAGLSTASAGEPTPTSVNTGNRWACAGTTWPVSIAVCPRNPF